MTTEMCGHPQGKKLVHTVSMTSFQNLIFCKLRQLLHHFIFFFFFVSWLMTRNFCFVFILRRVYVYVSNSYSSCERSTAITKKCEEELISFCMVSPTEQY